MQAESKCDKDGHRHEERHKDTIECPAAEVGEDQWQTDTSIDLKSRGSAM